VLLSRKVSVLLVVMVVVLVALGIGLSGAVGSASPKDDGDNNNDGGRTTTLTILLKTAEIEVVEVGPQGPSHGDMRVGNVPLYDQSGKKKVGRVDLFCALTDPSKKLQMTQCVRTYTLAGGEINQQGVSHRPSIHQSGVSKQREAITGGTGKYAGVRGESTWERRGDKAIITFHFID
jgi:allene oxide cyclase-like protein